MLPWTLYSHSLIFLVYTRLILTCDAQWYDDATEFQGGRVALEFIKAAMTVSTNIPRPEKAAGMLDEKLPATIHL